ncbi:MAG: TonB-dependent receptor [Chitinophagaceae bacterium]|nr:TonB-dependent receptor [Chitinophagaceae bacterium]
MNLTVTLFSVIVLQMSAIGSIAQHITLKETNAPLTSVLNKISKQSGYFFLYDDATMHLAVPVEIEIQNASLDKALSILFATQPFDYTIKGKTIVIKLRDNNPLSQHRDTVMPPQSFRITGQVSDAQGKPVDGVTVSVKGTTLATRTDAQGYYSISVPDGNTTLVFTSVGYVKQELVVKQSGTLNVTLKIAVSDLDEVVVVGYGEVRKGDLTGAVSSVKATVFEQSRQSSFINNIQGRVAGLQIASGTGEPGSGSKILIRGANSLVGNSRPLVVIDGIPVNESEAPIANAQFGANAQRDPLSSINPADIISVDVLKDASSTAIYGARGANGVILVTTRKGKTGAAMVTYDGRYAISQTAKRMKMLGGDDWINYRKDWVLLPDRQNIVYGYFQDWLFFENPSELEPSRKIPRDVYALPEFNWQDEMYRSIANSTAHNISISGGTATTKFYGSVGYNKEDGLFINNGYSRFNGRLRLDHNKDRLGLSFGLNGTFSRYDGAVQSGDGYANIGVIQTAIVSRPFVFENPLAVSTQGGWKIPTDNLNYLDRNISTPNLSSNLVINYRLLDGLYIGNTLSGTMVTSKVNEYYSKKTPWGYYLNGRGAITGSDWYGWTNFSTLSYERAFANRSRLNALGVFEVSGSRYEHHYIIKSSFADESTGIHDISKGEELQAAGSGAGIANRLSYLGRLNYDIKDRYLFTTSLRLDGSDRFGQNKRYGLFPSAAFAWRLSKESFLDRSWLNDLKLRVSYGATGNSNIPEFRYMATMGNVFYDDRLGMVPTSLPNPDLKWETTIQYNAGIDAAVFDNRLKLTLDFYTKKTNDMLFQAIVPAQSGFKTQWQNLGRVNNRGVEMALSTSNIRRRNFSWETTLTFSLNRNKVVEIGDGLSIAPVGAGYSTTSYIKQNVVGRIMVGQPIGVMYGYMMEGIYQLDDFSGWKDRSGALPDNDPNILWQNRNWVLKKGIPDAGNLGRLRPGTFKFKNTDGSEDGLITEDDKTVIGNGQPLFYGGLGNNFQKGPFELSIFINYSVGAKIFNSTRFELEGAMPGEYFNITEDFWDNRWTPENPTNAYPAYSDENYYNALASLPNSYYVEDASFIRLQTVSLSYTLPSRLLDKAGISSAKLYYSGNNLYTFTNYSGLSPEIDSGNPLLQNFDTIGYPRAKTHAVGVVVTF